jgi:hypothetical protein
VVGFSRRPQGAMLGRDGIRAQREERRWQR